MKKNYHYTFWIVFLTIHITASDKKQTNKPHVPSLQQYCINTIIGSGPKNDYLLEGLVSFVNRTEQEKLEKVVQGTLLTIEAAYDSEALHSSQENLSIFLNTLLNPHRATPIPKGIEDLSTFRRYAQKKDQQALFLFSITDAIYKVDTIAKSLHRKETEMLKNRHFDGFIAELVSQHIYYSEFCWKPRSLIVCKNFINQHSNFNPQDLVLTEKSKEIIDYYLKDHPLKRCLLLANIIQLQEEYGLRNKQ